METKKKASGMGLEQLFNGDNIDIASLKGISVNMIEAAMLARYLGIIIKD